MANEAKTDNAVRTFVLTDAGVRVTTKRTSSYTETYLSKSPEIQRNLLHMYQTNLLSDPAKRRGVEEMAVHNGWMTITIQEVVTETTTETTTV